MHAYRLVLVALVLVAVALGASGCTSRTTPIDYYWYDADGQLVVQVSGGTSDSVQTIGVDETEETVTITVWLQTPPLPVAGVGRLLNLDVDLPTPLGKRVLVDGSSGSPIDECRDLEWCTSRGGGSGPES